MTMQAGAPAAHDASAATLADWLADEARVLARHADGAARHAPIERSALAGMTGIEQLTAMLDGRLPTAPIARTLDFVLIRVEPGCAVFQGTPLARHYNPLGSVHGGWFATLLDSALGCAVHAQLPAGKAYTTLEVKMNIVRALSDRVPRVRAEGRVIHAGGQVATAEASMTGPDGRLYAHATTSCLIFPVRG